MVADTIETSLARLEEKINSLECYITKILNKYEDHELRLDNLEKWQNRLIGAFSAIMIILGIIFSLLKGI